MLQGLTSKEAAQRLLDLGPNEIIPSRLESRLAELRKILLDPMGLMLLAMAGLYAAMGNQSDAAILLVAYFPVTGVDVLLEIRAQRALRALRSTLKATAKVIRDGKVTEIPSRHVVSGDVLIFEEGQSLPADGEVLESEGLLINEAALTGESIPVEKTSGDAFFAGTIVLQGRGAGLVRTTARDTRFGKVATLLERTQSAQTPLQKKVSRLVQTVLIIALGLAIALFILEFTRGHTLVDSLIVALTFGMSAVPEEFPLVFTLYLSLGAWRLSHHGVLVKSLPAVEALGSVDIICTDKTGTLTEGRFQLESIIPIRRHSEAFLWQCCLMACEKNVVDSMERAIIEKGSPHIDRLRGWDLVWDYSFQSTTKTMSHVWKNPEGETILAMKGAVEGVLEFCSTDPDEKTKVVAMTNSLASQGKRLLGLACRTSTCTGIRNSDEANLSFVALLVFNDPVRESAHFAVQECQRAGIQIKMLTGDHPHTAHAIADQLGIHHEHHALYTGPQLATMKPAERWQAYREGTIFSRVIPEQKHEMVQALQSTGKVVAMTGDGINDAPALKLADIGISMGLNATDVARSTAQMILTKNDFKGIVEAVFEGRRVFSNLRRSFSYLISFHIPVIVLALFPPLLGWNELLLPVHIVLLELVVHPVSAFAFENLPHHERSFDKKILSVAQLTHASISGVLLSIVSLVAFKLATHQLELAAARSFALAIVLFGVMGFVIVESWPSLSRRLLGIHFSLVLLTIGLSQNPWLAGIFHTSPLSMESLAIALALGLAASLPGLFLRLRRGHQKSSEV